MTQVIEGSNPRGATMKITKIWDEHYYLHPDGLRLYRPKNLEGLIRINVECKMIESENTFTAFLSTEQGGPIISGNTIEECETKFKEAFLMSLIVGGLMDMDIKSMEKTLRDFTLENPKYLIEYKSGNVGLLGLFVGHLMKERKGKGDPKMILSITKNFLDKL